MVATPNFRISKPTRVRWAIQYEWDRITLGDIYQYIATMQERMDQAVERKGLETQYQILYRSVPIFREI